MADRQAQTRAPQAETKIRAKKSSFYPQARVTLGVVFENFSTPKDPQVFPVSPRSIKIHSNSYREADTWSLEFDAQDLPVSPDLIRGGNAEIFLFQSEGVGQIPETIRAKDDPETPRIEGLEPSIAGLFDEASLEMSDDGRWITIDGTDYTSLFLAKQWLVKKAEGKRASGDNGRCPSGKRVDLIIQDLMDEVESASALSLEVITEKPIPVVGASETRTNKKGTPVSPSDNYWDAMYSLALRHGFILYVENLKVKMVDMEALFKSKAENVRKMTFGRNLTSLRMKRRLGKETVPIIECFSYSDNGRERVAGRFPSNRRQIPVNGLGVERDEIKKIPVYGIRKKAQLEDIARQYYNQLARSEQTIEIETRDLVDMEGEDLIELRTGDAMFIGFDSFNNQNVILEGMSFPDRVQTLLRLNYDPIVAAVIAGTFDAVNIFKRPLRVREATFDWSYDGGLSISASLQNFIDAKGQTP